MDRRLAGALPAPFGRGLRSAGRRRGAPLEIGELRSHARRADAELGFPAGDGEHLARRVHGTHPHGIAHPNGVRRRPPPRPRPPPPPPPPAGAPGGPPAPPPAGGKPPPRSPRFWGSRSRSSRACL